MAILIFALILILIVGLCLYGIDGLPLDGFTARLLKLLVIAIAILLLVQRAGLV